MSRHFMALLSLLALLGARGAEAALKTVEEAHELALAAVTLPVTEVGQLIVRRCDECRPETLSTNANTRYFVASAKSAIPLAEIRRAAAAAARSSALVYVYFDPRTRVVRRLVLDAGR
jgi:hypothetical protein